MSELEFLTKVKGYMEDCEVALDSEWGDCRECSQLIADNAMPPLYDEVLKRIAEIEQDCQP